MVPDSTLSTQIESIAASLQYSSWLGIASLLIGLLGFALVIYQLRRTKTAAETASESSKKAIQIISVNQSFSDFGAIIGGLQEIQTANRGQRFETALIRIQTVRRQVVALRSKPQFEADSVQVLFQSLTVVLAKTQREYEEIVSGGSKPGSVIDINGSLGEFIVDLSELQQKMEFELGK